MSGHAPWEERADIEALDYIMSYPPLGNPDSDGSDGEACWDCGHSPRCREDHDCFYFRCIACDRASGMWETA